MMSNAKVRIFSFHKFTKLPGLLEESINKQKSKRKALASHQMTCSTVVSFVLFFRMSRI